MLVAPSAPTTGSLEAEVFGSNFDAEDLTCVWGGIKSVSARKVSSTQINCEIPATASGMVSLQVKTGVEFISNKLQFAFKPAPVIAKISPTSGQVTGGTRVVISGADIDSSSRLSCRFGAKIVPGLYISHSAMECFAPVAFSAGPLPLSMLWSLEPRDHTMRRSFSTL